MTNSSDLLAFLTIAMADNYLQFEVKCGQWLVLLLHTASSSNLSSYHRGRDISGDSRFFPAKFLPKNLTGATLTAGYIVGGIYNHGIHVNSLILGPVSGANFPIVA